MDAAFMREAIRLAIENVQKGEGGPFGAVIVREDAIIARGTNRVTNANDPTAHAEVVAIREACRALGGFQLTGCDLYTSCEPCPMCLGAIYWARPDRVFYAGSKEDAAAAGFDDAFIYLELDLPPKQRRLPMQQVLHEEAQAPFEAWREAEDKVEY